MMLVKRCPLKRNVKKRGLASSLSSVGQERKCQTMYGPIRSFLNDAGIEREMRQGIWAECALKATFYVSILVNVDLGKAPHELLFQKKIKRLSNLQSFGEMAAVTTNNSKGSLTIMVCMWDISKIIQTIYDKAGY
jgi:hypothetical protein